MGALPDIKKACLQGDTLELDPKIHLVIEDNWLWIFGAENKSVFTRNRAEEKLNCKRKEAHDGDTVTAQSLAAETISPHS